MIINFNISNLTKMIIDFHIKSNTYFKEILNSYKFYNYECPKCGSKYFWIRHAKYERNLVILENDKFVDTRMTILRLKCNSCNSTHAVLPGDIIPYTIYSFSCIVKLVLEHYHEGNSVLCIAKKYDVSFQLIYSFLALFISFMKECHSTLRILELINGILVISPKKIIKTITDKFIGSDYSKQYAKINKWPFLMRKFRNTYAIPIYLGFIYS